MKNPNCGHEMKSEIAGPFSEYCGELVFYCSDGGCAQWCIIFPAGKPPNNGNQHELLSLRWLVFVGAAKALLKAIFRPGS
ncbi:MAG: hypothetical protein GY928_05150 [Colwellia sp.]|nr:hypothetical protein [Colwellia sp.]